MLANAPKQTANKGKTVRKVFADTRREDFIAIDRWDDQTGCWYNVDEAISVKEAERKIEALMKIHATHDTDGVYSIVQMKRDVYKNLD